MTDEPRPLRLLLDADVCDCHGDCVLEAPELFDLGDEDEVVRLLQPTVEADQREAASRAIEACPVQALRFAP